MRKIFGVIAVLVSITFAGWVGHSVGKQTRQETTGYTTKGMKEESQKIAVVNLDEGAASEGKDTIYYGEKVIQFPNEFFTYTALEDARQGIENGTYAAYITIPSSFSNSVESLNGTPTQTQLQYAMNHELSGDTQTSTLYQILRFGELLNTDLSYMYLANILQEFHVAQDEVTNVMANDLADKEAIDKVKASDLVKMIVVPELKQEENKIEALNLVPYSETNTLLAKNIDDNYKENMADSQNQLDLLKEGGKRLFEGMTELSENIGEINLQTDENGVNVYENGFINLTNVLAEYNSGIGIQKGELTDKMEQLQEKCLLIYGALEQSITRYNQQLDQTNEENINQFASYRDNLKNAIPALECLEVAGSNETAYELKYSGYNRILNLSVKPESSLDIKKKESIKELMMRILTAVPETEFVQIPGINGGITVPKSLQTILQEIDNDANLQAKMQECGYSSALTMISEYAGGNMSFDQPTPQIVVNGNAAELTEDIKTSIDTVQWSPIPAEHYSGMVSMENEGAEEDILTVLNGFIDLFPGTKDQVSLLEGIDEDQTFSVVNNEIILPLVDRTESVKGDFQQRYQEEGSQIQEYQNSIEGYHPMLDTSNIAKFVSDMVANISNMQQDTDENNQSYVEFAGNLLVTTQENITTLQKHIEEAKDTANQVVEDGLAAAQSAQDKTSAENQQAMESFSKKLPYTRLGSMEYTQAYEFIANPVLMSQVSSYQRFIEESPLKGSEMEDSKEVTAPDYRQYIQWGLYILLAIIIGVVILRLLIRIRHNRLEKVTSS